MPSESTQEAVVLPSSIRVVQVCTIKGLNLLDKLGLVLALVPWFIEDTVAKTMSAAALKASEATKDLGNEIFSPFRFEHSWLTSKKATCP